LPTKLPRRILVGVMCCALDSPVVRHGRLIGIQAEFTPQVAGDVALAESIPVFVNERRHQSRITTRIPVPGNFGQGLLAEIQAARCLPPKRLLAEMPLSSTTPTASPGWDCSRAGNNRRCSSFEAEMEQQRRRSQSAHETIDLTVQGPLNQLAEDLNSTVFLGYTAPPVKPRSMLYSWTVNW